MKVKDLSHIISSEHLFFYTLSLGFFILPLVYWPWSSLPYEIPRVWFFSRWVEALFLLGIFSLKDIENKHFQRGLLITLLLFLVTAILASFLGVDFPKSIVGNYFRGDGLVTLFHLAGFALLMALYFKDEWKREVSRAIVLGAFLTSIVTIILAIRLYIFGDNTVLHWPDGSLGGSFGNSNFLGGYLAVSFAFLIYVFSLSKKIMARIWWGGCGGVIFAALLITQSWGSMVAFLLAIFVYIFFYLGRRMRLVVGLSILLLGAVSAFIFFSKVIDPTVFVAESRPRIVVKTLLGVGQRPILGYGWANVDYAFEKVPWPYPVRFDVYVDKAHSTLLEVLATSGIVGFLLYLFLCVMVIKVLWRKSAYYRLLLVVFIVYLFHAQTNIISIGEEVFFWFVIGVAMKS